MCVCSGNYSQKNKMKRNRLLKCAENMCVCGCECWLGWAFVILHVLRVVLSLFLFLGSPHTFVAFFVRSLVCLFVCIYYFRFRGKFIRIPYKGNDLISLFSTSDLVISSKYKPNLCAHREKTKWKLTAVFFVRVICLFDDRTSPCFLQHEYPCKQLLTSA